MDNNNFVFKNSILLTICCFFILNLRNLTMFSFVDDINVVFTASFYTITILTLIAIFIISLGITVPREVEDDIITTYKINEVFKYIHGSDNFVEPIPKLGFNMPIVKVDFSNYIFPIVLLLFIIMGSVNGGYASRKKKHNLKFSPTKNIVLGILMFSVMFLFFQLIFISIVNNVTRSQVNTNFNLYMLLFLFLLFFYSIIYCVFVKKQKKEQENNNNRTI